MLFLVQNENLENPYCDKRPFRVNAGGAHSYVRMPSGKTKYLAELQTGMTTLTVDPAGESRMTLVGRSKMEKRSMLLIDASVGERQGSILVQNAETVRLTKPDGESISVTQLKPGDEVLVAMEDLSFGRHFGNRITETIREI
jgi:3-dehydroquinate synthase II